LLSIDRGYVRPDDEVLEVTDPENESQADDETKLTFRASRFFFECVRRSHFLRT
jgi:hypothetical protein